MYYFSSHSHLLDQLKALVPLDLGRWRPVGLAHQFQPLSGRQPRHMGGLELDSDPLDHAFILDQLVVVTVAV